MAAETPSETGTLETRKDAGEGPRGQVKLWLDAIALAEKREENWRKKALEVEKRWRAEEHAGSKTSVFNILHTNQETLEPALYNATPTPDVRRRFGDQDPLAKMGAQVLERGLSYSIDAYDFDAVMHGTVHDALLAGRGQARVRYVPIQPKPDEPPTWEQVECEQIDWQDYLQGPGRRWSEVPWVAFRHRLTREEAAAKFPGIGHTVPLDWAADGAKEENGQKVPELFKRLTVWEIWDKQAREIVFIAPGYKEKPLKVEKDTLALREFYPCPRPIYDVFDPNDLVPVVPYILYENQAKELDRITVRINALIQVIKWRGARAALEELGSIAEAKDGDLVPIQNWQQLVASGGLDKSFWLMPIEQAVAVVKELYLAREQVKQTIFEITGVADIMRGQTDPDETLGAQQIKTQWGTLRLQRRQKEVQRFARDILRLKAELIAEKFSQETLAMMTGLDLPTGEQKQQAQMIAQQAPPQPGPDGQAAPLPPELQKMIETPSWDEVLQLIRQDGPRAYRIDIETDSTIEPDQAQAQKSMGEFVQGSAAYFEAFGPALQAGAVTPDIVVDLYTGMARQFKLGKQAEDALDRWAQMSQEMAANPPPRPDPDAEVKAKAAMEEQKLVLQAQAEERKMALEQRKADMDAEREERRLLAEEQREQRRMAMEEQRMGQEMEFKRRSAIMDRAMAAEKADADRETGVMIEREKLGVQREGQAEIAKKSELQQIQATLDEVVAALKTIVPTVERLADEMSDLTSPPEFIYGNDGRLAGKKQGRRTQMLKRGPDGKAIGLQ